ncbi:branched-chain amino acid ABC transporter permease [Hyphomicrobiales bacterium]|jgi:branched-chain amino acid transport system permease protein|nr:branched-chain amino acid ABC transporter permease [Hyphomicrobiales bacterium]|tara:strand:- start:1975 stop:2847 length:873 start_codon:yes stop_codon:yes gene_type:complete
MIYILQVIILGLCLGFVYALMATGLTLIFGVMRIVNLAHPIFILCGAYVAYWLFVLYGLDPILAIPIAAIVCGVLGAIVYKLVFEKDAGSQKYSEMTVLLTFGTAMILDGTLSFFFKNTQRVTSPSYATDAFFIGDIFLPTAQLYSGLVSLSLIVALALFLKFSTLGVAIRATSLSRVNAELVGINVKFVCLFSFILGCALAGCAGSLVSFVFSFFPAKHFEWIAVLMSLVVLGGMGSILGAVTAAIVLSVLASLVGAFLAPSWSTMVFFLALFVILLIRPQGMFGKYLS